MQAIIFIPLLAFLLDLILKDPVKWPHPVRLIGKLLDFLENYFRISSRISLKKAGIISLLISVVLIGLSISLLINLPLMGWIVGLYFAYAGLSLGGLLAAVKEVQILLQEGDLDSAREKLGCLVSRDTSGLEQQEIYKTLAETLSENFNDGFVAPYFYLIIGGPVLLWIYKAISTMDSMWGYKNLHWRDLGWAGAKMDDVLAYIPARISFLLIIAASFVLRGNWSSALKSSTKQARSMESPNAGWPMAASAWAVNAKMGGRAFYFGQVQEKPLLGPAGIDWNEHKLDKLYWIVFTAGCIWAVAGQSIWLLIL